MNKLSTQSPTKSILNKEYRWSNYSFIIDMVSFTLFNGLVILLMFLHNNFDDAINFENWVAIPVAIGLELLAILLSIWDSRKRNPKEKMIGSRIFNMPVFVITIMIIIAIFWGENEVLAIVYGGISGGFAGYLAGGLAYANFFIKIKDEIYRTIFGGWIGVVIGAIFGSYFGYLVDPINGEVFGGVFMGFWGGAIVSGPIATILLYLLRDKEKFTRFFTKIQLYGTIQPISKDMRQLLNIEGNKFIDLTQTKIFEKKESTEIAPTSPIWAQRLIVLFAAIFITCLTVFILFVLSIADKVKFTFLDNHPKLEIAGLILSIGFLVATIIGLGLTAAYTPENWWKDADLTKWKKVKRIFIYTFFLYNPWEIDPDENRVEAFYDAFKFAADKNGFTMENNIITA